ncbi:MULTISPECIES: cupin domain-containing protein [unclassified Gordonia (in: high G+C Gram-positive bacteria)]
MTISENPVSIPAIVVADPTSVELEDWGPLAEATGEAMATHGKTLWTGEGDTEVGVWRSAPGPSRWLLETNEFITVVAGRMTVTEDGGAPLEVAAGTSAFFPKGWSGTWDIHEEILKVYSIF